VPVSGVYYGTPSYSEDDYETWRRQSYVVPTDDPSAAYAASPAGNGRAAASRHICRSDAQKVPREQGGEAEVTVTRCYSVDQP
jgi:hypothetical protein